MLDDPRLPLARPRRAASPLNGRLTTVVAVWALVLSMLHLTRSEIAEPFRHAGYVQRSSNLCELAVVVAATTLLIVGTYCYEAAGTAANADLIADGFARSRFTGGTRHVRPLRGLPALLPPRGWGLPLNTSATALPMVLVVASNTVILPVLLSNRALAILSMGGSVQGRLARLAPACSQTRHQQQHVLAPRTSSFPRHFRDDA